MGKANYVMLREALKKNVPKSGKSPKGGGMSAPEIKKSTIQNVDFLMYMHTLDTSDEEKIR